MKTTLGEVKSIRDLFEKPLEVSRTSGNGGDWITEEAKCKLCEESVSGPSSFGITINNYTILSEMVRHIEFHKTIKELGI